MSFARTIILICLVILPSRGWSEASIELDPFFQDNMVLQYSTSTVIFGTGEPGRKVEIGFDGARKPAKTTVDRSGRWKVQMDLQTGLTPFSTGSLHVTQLSAKLFGKDSKIEKKNVFLGDVWLIAGWEGQGIRADAKEFSDITMNTLRSRTRVFDFSRNPRPHTIPQWEPWPAEFETEKVPLLKFAYFLTDRKFDRISSEKLVRPINIGIIRTNVIELKGQPPANNMFAALWNLSVAQRITDAQARRRRDLIHNKHRGEAVEIPDIIPYDPPGVVFYDAIPAGKRPPFTFRGAIFPVPGQKP